VGGKLARLGMPSYPGLDLTHYLFGATFDIFVLI
jgi:hypothetical protein